MSKVKTAKVRIADLHWNGQASLYRLSSPITYSMSSNEKFKTSYVIVSAINGHEVPGISMPPETYIFPATKDGKAIDMMELDGSYRGGMSHKKALNNAGYKLED